MAKSYSRNKITPALCVDGGRAGDPPLAAMSILPGMMASSLSTTMKSAVSATDSRLSALARIAVLTTIFIVAASAAASASWNAGLPGAIFRMPAGAWASGMGGAASAGPDFMLSWYNPSQLPLLRETRVSAGLGLRSLGRTEAWGSYDFRVPPRVGMGLSLVYRGDPFVNGLYDGYYSGGGPVEERELAGASWTAVSAKIGAGYMASRKWSFGGSVAINYQRLPTTPAPDGKIEASEITSIGALDIAATYRITQSLTLAASVRSLMSRNDWNIYSSDVYSPAVEEVVPPVFVLSSSHRTALLERELTWNADAMIFFIDGEGNFLNNPELVLAVGARWNFTETITLRAGIADLEFSADLITGHNDYRDGFSPRVAAGFSYALPKFGKGAFLNYALLTDRVWAGVDQQLDITVSF